MLSASLPPLVSNLEALISEARHLASEEDAGTVHADLGGNLARTTGSGGEGTSWTPHAGAHAWGYLFYLARPWFWCARRDGCRVSERIGAMVQLVNHTDVVSVEDLEALISEARHLASEEDAGTVHADLGGNLARTTGSGGEAT